MCHIHSQAPKYWMLTFPTTSAILMWYGIHWNPHLVHATLAKLRTVAVQGFTLFICTVLICISLITLTSSWKGFSHTWRHTGSLERSACMQCHNRRNITQSCKMHVTKYLDRDVKVAVPKHNTNHVHVWQYSGKTAVTCNSICWPHPIIYMQCRMYSLTLASLCVQGLETPRSIHVHVSHRLFESVGLSYESGGAIIPTAPTVPTPM